tara:strand:+ start:864 stop:1124 length:261 start_codon:yes stop_codon:yes gene_type:complete
MDINQLIEIVKNKISKEISLESIEIIDKTFLHKKHKNHQDGKFHIKILIYSKELNKHSKLLSTKKIYKLLDDEIKNYIHSIELSLN